MAPLSSQDLGQTDDRIGQTLCGKWRIERSLGCGASAVVYAARHHNGKRVAVKVLSGNLAAHPLARERFLNEGRAANRVGHSGVAEVYDEGETDDGSLFLVMDYLQGQTLQARLDKEGALPFREVLYVAQQVLAALECAHANGVLHRDIKPENVFVTDDGRVKLLDFGIARSIEARNLTQTGVPVGTPAFMPPEQAQGAWHLVDESSDLWSLAATLFVLASGHTVRPQMSVEKEVRHAASKPVRSLASVCDAPRALVELVDRALCFKRANRFDSASSMRRAVDAAIADLELTESEVSEVRQVATLHKAPLRTIGSSSLSTDSTSGEPPDPQPADPQPADPIPADPQPADPGTPTADPPSVAPGPIAFRSRTSRVIGRVLPLLIVCLPCAGVVFAMTPESTWSVKSETDSRASLDSMLPEAAPMPLLGRLQELPAAGHRNDEHNAGNATDSAADPSATAESAEVATTDDKTTDDNSSRAAGAAAPAKPRTKPPSKARHVHTRPKHAPGRVSQHTSSEGSPDQRNKQAAQPPDESISDDEFAETPKDEAFDPFRYRK